MCTLIIKIITIGRFGVTLFLGNFLPLYSPAQPRLHQHWARPGEGEEQGLERNWSFCGLLVCDLQLVADLSQPSPASSPTQVSKLGPTGDPSPTFYILCTEFSFWECTYHVPIPPLLYCATRKAWYRPQIWSNVAIMTHFFANNEYRRWSWAGSRGTSRTWELCPAARADMIRNTWPGTRAT